MNISVRRLFSDSRYLPGILFLLGFIIFGLRAWRETRLLWMIKDEPDGLRVALESEASADAYIRELLLQEGAPASEISHPSLAIQKALAELPPHGSILFVAPRNQATYEVMFLVVKTLTLPRSIDLTWCEGPAPPLGPAREEIAAVMYYLVAPPAEMQGAKMIIPRLILVPGSEAKKWTSFCSR
jgi:hypothetical protein